MAILCSLLWLLLKMIWFELIFIDAISPFLSYVPSADAKTMKDQMQRVAIAKCRLFNIVVSCLACIGIGIGDEPN